MNTQYNTLTLASQRTENVEQPNKRAKVVVAAAFLMAIAGFVAFAATTSSQKVNASMDSEYQALEAAPVNCDSSSHDYNEDLPRWDPAYSDQEAFYNACYYSFRCCTTTGNGNGCYVSDNFGDMCKSCIKANGPRFVKSDCLKYVKEFPEDKWKMADLLNDNGVPFTKKPDYAVNFNNWPGAPTEEHPVDTRSCWQQRGSEDKQVIAFSSKCFEVLSWCNLLCPRDTPQTVDHVMCKHCTLFGFEDGYWNIGEFKKEVKDIAPEV